MAAASGVAGAGRCRNCSRGRRSRWGTGSGCARPTCAHTGSRVSCGTAFEDCFAAVLIRRLPVRFERVAHAGGHRPLPPGRFAVSDTPLPPLQGGVPVALPLVFGVAACLAWWFVAADVPPVCGGGAARLVPAVRDGAGDLFFLTPSAPVVAGEAAPDAVFLVD